MNPSSSFKNSFLYTFTGEDKNIIKLCNEDIQDRFKLIGAFVFIMFIGCLISAGSFVFSLFEGNLFVAIPFSIIWAFLVTNIYLLLIYTISPSVLPHAQKINRLKKRIITKENRISDFFTFSMVFRLSFMVILAIIIAQPLNVFFLSLKTDSSIEKYKAEQRANMIVQSNKLLIQKESDIRKSIELQILQSNKVEFNELLYKIGEDELFSIKALVILAKIDSINKGYRSQNDKLKRDVLVDKLNLLIENEIQSDENFILKNEKNNQNGYSIELSKLISEKLTTYSKLDKLLEKSNFYIQKIKILLRETMLAWLLIGVVIFVFLYPIYLKFKIRNELEFYEIREKREKEFVVKAYKEFKIQYKKILEKRIESYNNSILNNVVPHLDKLKIKNTIKFAEIRENLEKECRYELIDKYEKYYDAPFRTKKKELYKSLSNNQDELLKLLYPQES
jgi:hypothetical protein